MIIDTEFNIGDEVIDGLLGTKTKIIGISFSSGHTDGNLYRNSGETRSTYEKKD